MSESNSKQPKIQDYACAVCSKRFNDLPTYEIHQKTKHCETKPEQNLSEVRNQSKNLLESEARTEQEKPKLANKPKNKNKGSEQMQQDAEDKIYAFLGQLSVKHVEPDSQQENINEDDDRMMGQANYLENNIVRTPFEIELDVKKEIEMMPQTGRANFDNMLQIAKEEAIALNQKLALETEKWEFRDPIEMEKQQEEQFSLINIPNVLSNYKKKGLNLAYPHCSVFLLWLAKICKPISWKEFFLITAFVDYKFDEFLKTKQPSIRTQSNWKQFFTEVGQKNLGNIVDEIQGSLHLFNKEQISNFIDLYEKWVCYFDPL